MEVLSRPKAFSRVSDTIDDEPTPGPSMPSAPSTVTRSPPRLPSADHQLTIPARPSIATRRHSATVGSLSPSHLSRPLRSSPLAGPSIAASANASLVASAPSTPGGGFKHLSPLAESSITIPVDTSPVVDPEVKKQRRRTLGSVLSKLSLPTSSGASSEPTSPITPVAPPRPRTKSATAQDAPPVPPVPTWVHNTMPARVRPPHPHASSSTPSPPRAHTAPIHGSPKSSRPTSPTPSARSTGSVKHTADPRRMSFRPPPSTSRSPEDNWLTQSAAPRFSRLGLKAEGVILPVSAREARRRSTASLASLASTKTHSVDALPPPPMPVRTNSRESTASIGSLTASSAPANQQQFRSRASSRASLASAASGYGSVYCDTPSLTMSPGPSASDVSLNSQAPTVDEMGVMFSPGHVQLQLNDVPVGVLSLPAPAYKDKGKARAADVEHEAPETERGTFARWTRGSKSSTPSIISSAATSVADLPAGGAPLHMRAATAPELLSGSNKEKTKRPHALGRMWKQVVRSVTTRR